MRRRIDGGLLPCRLGSKLFPYANLQGSSLGNEMQSFVVRIWQETADGNGRAGIWRGSIDHVGSGKRLYFCDLNGIVRFVQEQSGLEVGPVSRTRKSIPDRIRLTVARLYGRFQDGYS